MIYPEHISDSKNAFAYFIKVTSLSRFLKGRERWAFYLSLPLFYVTWALITWALHASVHFPIYHIPLIVFSALGKHGSQWATCFIYVGILALVFAPWYARIPSASIKKSLQRRNIIVKGRHWRGAEVERIVLDEFISYLGSQGLYNPDALEQLIESVRDEATADSRPSLRFYTVLAICFAIVIGFWQAVFSQWLETWIKKENWL